MHELSVTESILEIALRHAEQAGGCRITALHLVLGDLATIVDDSVQFYWDIISQGTIAEGAVMSFERIPARIRCLDCDLEYTPEPGTLECPECQGIHLKIITGEEFYLSAIDIEKNAP
ncbi:MAG: hydrogenase maturation nickel metallochaperone HypA [Anaerolineales bacterium]